MAQYSKSCVNYGRLMLSSWPRGPELAHQAMTSSAWPTEVFQFMIQKPGAISERSGHLYLQVLIRMTTAGSGHLGCEGTFQPSAGVSNSHFRLHTLHGS